MIHRRKRVKRYKKRFGCKALDQKDSIFGYVMETGKYYDHLDCHYRLVKPIYPKYLRRYKKDKWVWLFPSSQHMNPRLPGNLKAMQKLGYYA